MVADAIPQLKTFSVAQKRKLVAELIEELWGEPVTEPKLMRALSARLARYRKNPSSARPWSEVKKRLRARK